MLKPFVFLANNSTDKRPYLYGLLPSVSTVFTLLAVSAVLTFVPMLWAAAAFQLSAYMGYFAYTFASVVAFSAFNFWFDREINYADKLSCTIINPGDKYKITENDLRVVRMVNHLVQELNAFDGTQDPSHPNHLPVPRIAKFSDLNKTDVVGIPGRNVNDAMIALPEGFANGNLTRHSEQMAASMILAQLYHIKRRRSIPDRLHGLVEKLNDTFNNLMKSDNPFLKTVGYICQPLQLLFLVHNAVLRSHVYEASEVVVRCGRGKAYLDALNNKGHGSRSRKLGDSECIIGDNLQHRITAKRAPYDKEAYKWMKNGGILKYISFLGRWADHLLKPIADWVDSKEYVTDEKTKTSRFTRFFDALVRSMIFYVKEINSTKPAGPNQKGYIKNLLDDASVDKRPIKIDPKDVYEPIDPTLGIRWRLKKALKFGTLSFDELKDKGARHEHNLGYALKVRNRCKTRLLDYLHHKGLHFNQEISKADVQRVLEPLMFSHNVNTSSVEVDAQQSITNLKDLLQQNHKRYRNQDLNGLFAGKTFNPPVYKP